MVEVLPKRRMSIGAGRSAETANAILDATHAIIVEQGISFLTIEAVAKRARAGKPTIYRWWPNKTALLMDVYLRLVATETPVSTGDVEEDILAFVDQTLSVWNAAGAADLYRLMIAESQSDEFATGAWCEFGRSQKQRAVEIFVAGIRSGQLAKEVDPEAAADMLMGFLLHGLLTRNLGVMAGNTAPAARQLVRGLLTSPSNHEVR